MFLPLSLPYPCSFPSPVSPATTLFLPLFPTPCLSFHYPLPLASPLFLRRSLSHSTPLLLLPSISTVILMLLPSPLPFILPRPYSFHSPITLHSAPPILPYRVQSPSPPKTTLFQPRNIRRAFIVAQAFVLRIFTLFFYIPAPPFPSFFLSF